MVSVNSPISTPSFRSNTTNYPHSEDVTESEDAAFLLTSAAMNDSPQFLDPSQTGSSSDSTASPSSLDKSLAWRLRHFDYSLEALQALRSRFFKNEHLLPDEEFCLSASSIMDLIEIAKSTLEDVGIDLWPHSPCFVSLRPHKKAYFALLKLLRSRTDCLNTQLRARSLRLTCRLSTKFSIHLDPAYDFYLPPKPRRPKRNMDSSQPQQLKEVCRSMPPPDAFPPSGFTPISSRSLIGPQRRRKRMCLDFSSEVWDSLAMVPLPRQLHPSLHNKLHTSASASGNPSPNRRPAAGNSNTFKKQRFGIFCTGKTEFGLGGRARVISMGPGKQSYRRF
ncbi:hypothetical protein BT96DRAFT_929191 [Gymnopus androsaceus JB14]|uniref:Uncharacterized protein n=1 Tax=Gymnopus androsaceus JB14 TaxID=1447944 RepID=A0A6A4GGP9_9AGAR|nr:hypothetical protein BT96DRAFT_929191 [Gymnopus androsaceus JB14]